MKSLAALAILGCCAWAAPACADILIATAGPITGANAIFGVQMREGATQAVDDLNARGGVLGQHGHYRPM